MAEFWASLIQKMVKIFVKNLSKKNTPLNTGVELKQDTLKKMGLGANKMSRIISEEGISLIKNYEGCKLESYQDSVGVWTIAYGHTKDVKEGDSINQDEAEHLLAEEMPEYEGYINNMVKVPLEQNQFDALVCWVYNLGPTNLQESTLLRILNEGDYEGVPEQIKRWNKAGGVTLGGLVKRREAEADLFEGKEWSKV
jgi:lysozyme